MISFVIHTYALEFDVCACVWDSFMHDESDFDYYYLTWIMCAYGTAGEESDDTEKKLIRVLYTQPQSMETKGARHIPERLQ